MREKEIDKLKEYKYGFSTDIENVKAPKGLNEDVVKFIKNGDFVFDMSDQMTVKKFSKKPFY